MKNECKYETNHSTLTYIHIKNHTIDSLVVLISHKDMLMWKFIIPSSCQILINRSSLMGFVKISASYLSVEMNSNTTSPLLTWSLKTWCLIC